MFKKIMLLILCIALCFSFSSCALKKGIVSVDGSNVDEAYFKYYFTTLKNTIQTQQGEDSWQDTTLDGKPALHAENGTYLVFGIAHSCGDRCAKLVRRGKRNVLYLKSALDAVRAKRIRKSISSHRPCTVSVIVELAAFGGM